MIQDKIVLISDKLNAILKSEYLSFAEVAALKNITGVYFIFNGVDELLYIGNTNEFHIRFGTDLKHESTHTFVRKLIKFGVFSSRYEVVHYLTGTCKFKIAVCETKREAEALESLSIYILNPIYNK